MASTIYEYPTPSIGGYVHGKKIFLTFPHWGVQCIDRKSGSILSTWNRPTRNHVFTSPITYSNDNKWLITSIYNKNDNENDNKTNKKCSILLWNINDLQIKNKLIDLDTNKLCENEFIIRIFHSHICHHYFIIITNLSNIILFNPNTNTFDYKSNPNKTTNNNQNLLLNVKLHDSISKSGYHKKLTHISFIYSSKIQIIPISFNNKLNTLSIHNGMELLTPKYITFEINNNKNNNDKVLIIDYDWCFDTNNLLLLSANGFIECFTYLNIKNSNVSKYTIKYKINVKEYLDLSSMNELNRIKLNNNNLLFSLNNSQLLSFIRIKFIEDSQFIIIGPCNKEYNTLKLWLFQFNYGVLRDEITLIPQNTNSNLLMIAPIICNKNKDKIDTNQLQSINIHIITSKQVLFITVPCSGKSLLDLIENSIKSERKMNIDNNENENKNEIVLSMNNANRIKRFVNKKDWNDAQILLNELRTHNTKIDGALFNLMVNTLMEHKKWVLIKCYFVLIKDYSETNLLYLLSLIINNLKTFGKNEMFLTLFNTILSAKMNDIFMKRCIQILPQTQVEILMKYLCDKLNNNKEMILDINVIIVWLNIILDAHLATLAFSENVNLYKNYIIQIKECLNNYDRNIQMMIDIQANIHYILNEMKIEYNNKKKSNNPINKHLPKITHGMGGGALTYNSKSEQNPNDPNLYKDYVVEYIKL